MPLDAIPTSNETVAVSVDTENLHPDTEPPAAQSDPRHSLTTAIELAGQPAFPKSAEMEHGRHYDREVHDLAILNVHERSDDP